MSLIVMPNGTINSENVVGALPPRADRPYWRLSGSSIIVDQAAKTAALEAEVDSLAQEIASTGDLLRAGFLATIDYGTAIDAGQTTGMNTAQRRALFLDRVEAYLRAKRGL